MLCLVCWFHVIRRCRAHRNLLTKQQWNETDKEVHVVQLRFSGDVFNYGVPIIVSR